MDNLRVSELAKELNITSKELIEKFAEISISVKSHSNVVTPEQVRKIKEHLGFHNCKVTRYRNIHCHVTFLLMCS